MRRWLPIVSLGAAACSGGADPRADMNQPPPGPPAPPVIASGCFKGPTMRGINYRSGARLGITDDAGCFEYEVGEPLVLFIGSADSGTIEGIALGRVQPKEVVTVLDFLPADRDDIMRLLLMLDDDNDASTGITISAALRARAKYWHQPDYGTARANAVLAAIQSDAVSADGAPHVLSDAATATARRTESLYCNYAGLYLGAFNTVGRPAQDAFGSLYVFVLPSGFVMGGAFQATRDGPRLWAGISSGPLSPESPEFHGGGIPSFYGTFRTTAQIEGGFSNFSDHGYLSAGRMVNNRKTVYRFISVSYQNPAPGDYRTLHVVADLSTDDRIGIAVLDGDGTTASEVQTRLYGDQVVTDAPGRYDYSGSLQRSPLRLRGTLLDLDSGYAVEFDDANPFWPCTL